MSNTNTNNNTNNDYLPQLQDLTKSQKKAVATMKAIFTKSSDLARVDLYEASVKRSSKQEVDHMLKLAGITGLIKSREQVMKPRVEKVLSYMPVYTMGDNGVTAVTADDILTSAKAAGRL